MHYVIGDVHGCFDELTRLLEAIHSKDSDAHIIFVGDFIDRGPKVIETLDWVLNHITPDGVYRSVLGNHEQMVIDWYHQVKDSWTDDATLPLIHYGFDKELKKAGRFTKEYMEEITRFFSGLPLHVDLSVTSKAGKKIDYVISHAYVPTEEERNTMSDEQLRDIYLWSRQHFWGYHGRDDRILVHGHTPTIEHEYLLRNSSVRPGLIGYGANCINVDSGCCFFYYGEGEAYPCMLSAICLEDLTEIYSDTIEERFGNAIDMTEHSLFKKVSRNDAIEILTDHYLGKIRGLGAGLDKPSFYQQKLFDRLGL